VLPFRWTNDASQILSHLYEVSDEQNKAIHSLSKAVGDLSTETKAQTRVMERVLGATHDLEKLANQQLTIMIDVSSATSDLVRLAEKLAGTHEAESTHLREVDEKGSEQTRKLVEHSQKVLVSLGRLEASSRKAGQEALSKLAELISALHQIESRVSREGLTLGAIRTVKDELGKLMQKAPLSPSSQQEEKHEIKVLELAAAGYTLAGRLEDNIEPTVASTPDVEKVTAVEEGLPSLSPIMEQPTLEDFEGGPASTQRTNPVTENLPKDLDEGGNRGSPCSSDHEKPKESMVETITVNETQKRQFHEVDGNASGAEEEGGTKDGEGVGGRRVLRKRARQNSASSRKPL
jgi:hypothetical protein